ncbi:MAG: cytochrome-c peroxidase [Bacteroidetes bacterium]|nr:cytochrome-c peroxidase [Bacteroidota bacterium]
MKTTIDNLYSIQTLLPIGRRVLMLLLLSIFIVACQKDPAIEEPEDEVITLQVPKGFPYPKIPDDNQPTRNRIDLGKKIFFDPILSRDSTISCGSCHLTDKKFTDGLQFSVGIGGKLTTRNSMTILNTAYQPNMFWDGGVPSLEQQVLAPIENPLEMDFDINKVVVRLNSNAEYVQLFEKAYKMPPSVYTLTRAIACYERSLFSGESRYDEYLYEKNTAALTPSEINGMNIFFGEQGECFHCHGEFNFTDYSFKNNGLYLNYADSGRARITALPSDVGKFKVPSLRNIELTAPYMHDGSLATLTDVIEHYNSGGKAHPNKSGLIQPLNLSAQEKQDIINFLNALTDK